MAFALLGGFNNRPNKTIMNTRRLYPLFFPARGKSMRKIGMLLDVISW